MTDELTSEQEAAVRRLLAEARHDGPVPDDVAARLDDALDALVANEGVDDLEIFESDSPTAVTDLSGVRRRRRNAGRLLLAAAAIVVGGVAVGQALGSADLDGANDAGGAADGSLAEEPRDNPDRDQEQYGDSGAGEDAPEAATAAEVDLLARVQAPLPLTSERFAADVQRELSGTATARRKAANADYDGVLAYAALDASFVCPDGRYGEGATLPAYYDAEEAVLVLRRPRAGIQRVDLLTCGTAEQLDSAELRAP